MRVTGRLYRSFIGRSIDDFRRMSQITLGWEVVKGFPTPLVIANFHDATGISDSKVMSDADMGGFSEAHLDWVPPAKDTEQGHARFHGNISIQLPPHRPEVQRTGYAGWRTLERGYSIFGKGIWNIDPYEYLALRVKSDGRKYFINVQSDTLVPTDLHQHRLYTKTPGQWETVLVKWSDFVRTNHGRVVEPQNEMMRERVKTVGISLIDRVPGPFDLSIQKIWACNVLSKDEQAQLTQEGTGSMRNKQGEAVSWNLPRKNDDK